MCQRRLLAALPRLNDLVFSNRNSISSRTFGEYLTTRWMVPALDDGGREGGLVNCGPCVCNCAAYTALCYLHVHDIIVLKALLQGGA